MDRLSLESVCMGYCVVKSVRVHLNVREKVTMATDVVLTVPG